MTNNNNKKYHGIAFIKMPMKNHFEIFVKFGFQVTNLYASNSYKYDPILKTIAIDGVLISEVEELVFNF